VPGAKEREREEETVLFRLELVDLLDVDGETSGGVELSRALTAFEVLCLLMLHQH
jgi:hypothetical protein